MNIFRYFFGFLYKITEGLNISTILIVEDLVLVIFFLLLVLRGVFIIYVKFWIVILFLFLVGKVLLVFLIVSSFMRGLDLEVEVFFELLLARIFVNLFKIWILFL